MISFFAPTGPLMRPLAEGRNLVRSFFDRMPFCSASLKEEVPDFDDEPEVVEILQGLDGERQIFDRIATRSGTIDHVVISEAHGIFLIETKSHRGRVAVVDSKIRVNGRLQEKDFVAQTLRNTYWLIEEIRSATGLDAIINPLIVFTHASVALNRPLKGIPMTNRKLLLAAIQAQGEPIDRRLWEVREQISAMLAHHALPARQPLAVVF